MGVPYLLSPLSREFIKKTFVGRRWELKWFTYLYKHSCTRVTTHTRVSLSGCTYDLPYIILFAKVLEVSSLSMVLKVGGFYRLYMKNRKTGIILLLHLEIFFSNFKHLNFLPHGPLRINKELFLWSIF